jgi:hypothetical protein
VYVSHVDSSSLGFSLSSHRQSYIGLVFSSRVIDSLTNNKPSVCETCRFLCPHYNKFKRIHGMCSIIYSRVFQEKELCTPEDGLDPQSDYHHSIYFTFMSILEIIHYEVTRTLLSLSWSIVSTWCQSNVTRKMNSHIQPISVGKVSFLDVENYFRISF